MIKIMDDINNIEYWQPLTCYNIIPGRYNISTFGRVFDLNKNVFVYTHILNSGYESIRLQTCTGDKNFLVHRLVARTFIMFKCIDQTQVNHINTHKTDNRICNLEWNTPKQNTNHALENGRFVLAEDRETSIFTNEQVHTICSMIEQGTRYKDIIIYLGLDPNNQSYYDAIGCIKRGLTYKCISENYNLENTKYVSTKYNEQEIRQICEYIQIGYDYKQIANILGVNIEGRANYKKFYEFIRKIRKRELFKEISKDYIW